MINTKLFGEIIERMKICIPGCTQKSLGDTNSDKHCHKDEKLLFLDLFNMGSVEVVQTKANDATSKTFSGVSSETPHCSTFSTNLHWLRRCLTTH